MSWMSFFKNEKLSQSGKPTPIFDSHFIDVSGKLARQAMTLLMSGGAGNPQALLIPLALTLAKRVARAVGLIKADQSHTLTEQYRSTLGKRG